MKRSRSGTRPRDNSQRDADPRTRRQALLLGIAALVVLAFVFSFVMGLRKDDAAVAEPEEIEAPQPVIVGDARARVEVLNASGRSGLARAATTQLRDAGFDVVGFGNTTIAASSEVIDRVGKPDVAREVGAVLSITTTRVAVDSSRFVEATVVLGRDWAVRTAARQQETKKRWYERLLRR